MIKTYRKRRLNLEANDMPGSIHGVHDSEPAYKMLWAKSDPYKQLSAHMIDTGCCTMTLLRSESSKSLLVFLSEQWKCSEERAASFASYFAALHDIGKAIPQFQMQNEDCWSRLVSAAGDTLLSGKNSEPIRHEYASARIMRRIWKKQHVSRPAVDGYACVLSLHHQKINLSSGLRHKEEFPGFWQEMQEQLERLIRKTFAVSDGLPVPDDVDAVCVMLTGLIILCDWVASSGPFESECNATDDGYFSYSMATAEKTMRSYGLIGEQANRSINGFHDLWPQIGEMRDIQKQCEKLNPASPLTIIEAPMGEGKTEAALYIAEKMKGVWNKRGIYMALPTQATSNQMYGRIDTMLNAIGGGHVRLMHGMAFLQNTDPHIQSEDAAAAEAWLGSSRMSMLDENGVGTVDQAMAGVLLSRFSILRLLGLSNKVLVIDELHAYDAYMSEIIKTLLQWCCALHIPVVLLSATLQDSQRRKYLSCFTGESEEKLSLSNAYPLITQVDRNGELMQKEARATMETSYEFKTAALGTDCSAIAAFANQIIQKGGCYCILVNTVKKAQAVYRALLETKDSDTETFLFHARFPVGRRDLIEKECLKKFGKGKNCQRPAKAILVATQVVEQSLDIDFDGMLTDLAPIDLLLQRAGRVHRHRDRIRPAGFEKAVVHVIVPRESSTDLEKRYADSGYVYAPFLLYNTEQLLNDGLFIRVPQDLRQVIGTVYEKVTAENWHIWQERAFSQQFMQANAKGVTFPEPNCRYFFPAQSHPEFVNMEVDDGFEPSIRASTRLGEPVCRIAFSDSETLEKARSGRISVKDKQTIILESVSLSMRHLSERDLISGGLYKIDRSALKGCYISEKNDRIRIGNKDLVNDPVLGVLWEES